MLTPNGKAFRLAGLGMPKLKGKERGHLYARVQVRLPEKLSDDDKKLFEQLREKCPQVWRHYVSGFDVTQLVNLIAKENRKDDSWHTPSIYGLFNELYRADKTLARQLQTRCPDRISAEWLDNLAKDFP